MASEILGNLQLGSLILSGIKLNSISSTTGALLTVPAGTVTDTATAASGSLTQFHGAYFGVPTLAATNTGVTTTAASTLTVAGAPVAGTNETLTAAYALQVLAGSSRFLGSVILGAGTVSPYAVWTGTVSVNNATVTIVPSTPSTTRGAALYSSINSSGYIYVVTGGVYAVSIGVGESGSNYNGSVVTANVISSGGDSIGSGRTPYGSSCAGELVVPSGGYIYYQIFSAASTETWNYTLRARLI